MNIKEEDKGNRIFNYRGFRYPAKGFVGIGELKNKKSKFPVHFNWNISYDGKENLKFGEPFFIGRIIDFKNTIIGENNKNIDEKLKGFILEKRKRKFALEKPGNERIILPNLIFNNFLKPQQQDLIQKLIEDNLSYFPKHFKLLENKNYPKNITYIFPDEFHKYALENFQYISPKNQIIENLPRKCYQCSPPAGGGQGIVNGHIIGC